MEDAEYFFHLQRLIAAGDVGEAKVTEGRAALAAVHETTWGFAYYNDKLKRNERPYTSNASLLLEVKQRAGRVIDQWWRP